MQVIYRALSPPLAAQDPYSAEAQAQLKVTNLRVRLLERQSCPCLLPAPQAPPAPHYAVYDFIVKGSCFCNGHADRCVPVSGFRPVKAAGVFQVVRTRARRWLLKMLMFLAPFSAWMLTSDSTISDTINEGHFDDRGGAELPRWQQDPCACRCFWSILRDGVGS